MKDNCSRKFWCGRAAENIARGILVAFVALAISGIASAQGKQDNKDEFALELLSNVSTPTAITPPVGNHLFLAGHAFGSQGYVCLPKDGSVSWTVNGARPEATLFARQPQRPHAPRSLRQRDLAEFLRQQQSVGKCKSGDNDCRRHRPELPEYWLD